MAFDLSQYETVHDRLNRFWTQWPAGRVYTELIAYSDTQYIFKASIYKDAADEKPLATGFAEERVGSSYINKTSAAENAETSAIGRALANANFAAKAGKPRASQEEMSKADRYQVKNGEVAREAWKDGQRGSWAEVGQITTKQISFVERILKDACVSAGFEYGPDFFKHLSDWLSAYQPLTSVEELSKQQASTIINDSKSATGKQVSKLVSFLQSKKDPAHDPWEKPAF